MEAATHHHSQNIKTCCTFLCNYQTENHLILASKQCSHIYMQRNCNSFEKPNCTTEPYSQQWRLSKELCCVYGCTLELVHSKKKTKKTKHSFLLCNRGSTQEIHIEACVEGAGSIILLMGWEGRYAKEKRDK